MNELRNIIGKPWALPSTPPANFNCWALAVFVRNLVGLKTPAVVQGDEIDLLDRKYLRKPPSTWKQIEEPTNHCIVRMGLAHVGVYLKPARVLHVPINDAVRIDQIENVGEVTFWEVADA